MKRTKSQQLIDYTLDKFKNIELTHSQSVKFSQACEKTIIDNPELNINDLCIAAKIYLNLILNNPELQIKP